MWKQFLLVILAVIIPASAARILFPTLGWPASIAISYILLLIILRFIDIKQLVGIGRLDEYLHIHEIQEKQIVIPGKVYNDPIFTSSLKELIEEPSIEKISKVRFLGLDSGSFIVGFQSSIIELILLNVILLAIASAATPDLPIGKSEWPKECLELLSKYKKTTELILVLSSVAVQITWLLKMPFLIDTRNKTFLSELRE
jgi:hypothetical protein